jgi:hypothetical protein
MGYVLPWIVTEPSAAADGIHTRYERDCQSPRELFR